MTKSPMPREEQFDNAELQKEFDKWVEETKPTLPQEYKIRWLPNILKELRTYYKIEPEKKRLALADFIWHEYQHAHREGFFNAMVKIRNKK